MSKNPITIAKICTLFKNYNFIHPIAIKILVELKTIHDESLRSLCRKINEKYPQTVKHHLEKLISGEYIDVTNKGLKTSKKGKDFIQKLETILND